VPISLDLSDRVALVTGGSQGIGAGIAEVLVRAGATVVTCARSAVPTPAPGTTHVQCDVRDPEAVAAMVDAVVDEHGRLDILVNNAGGSPYALAADASPRLLEKVLDLNLTAPLVVARAANAVMQRQGGGVIVNISSVSALRPSPGTAAYGAAKAGVDSLTRSLAVEWGPKVRVNTVDVGLCRTEQSADHYGSDETVRAIEQTIPLGRMAEPAEVGQVVAFLASDLASYVSGACVECHGGGEPPAFLVAQGLHIVQKENQ
jgi:NAD(P)-dependent dehydrogenase (short-subunit alcohol dehydrogenase family)